MVRIINILLIVMLAPWQSEAMAADALLASGQADTTQLKPRKRKLSAFRRMVRGFSKVDTNYIEPQKYNFTVMLQNTTSFEGYTLRTRDGNEVVFSPEPSYKIGPYFGWRFVFLGYTIDLKHLSGSSSRQAIDLSLYAPQIGLDLFYRKSGDNYRIGRVDFGRQFNNSLMRHADFDGFESSERGISMYYIFNHQKFSYPAAYSQSTIQRRSAGSAIVGASYSRHSLSVDWDEFHLLMDRLAGPHTAAEVGDTSMHSTEVRYNDISVGGGYAYNWVFAHNWLVDVSLQLALGYKQSSSKTNGEEHHDYKRRNFNFKNFNLDGVSRVGIVWNNMRWYAGASAIFHTYNYRRSRFRANTTFGNINIYAGYNFGLKKRYRK